MTTRERLRMMIGDTDKLRVNEPFGVGDGNTVYFKLKLFPVRANSQVFILEPESDGDISALTETTDYTLDDDTGQVDFTPSSAPNKGAKIVAQKYEYNAFSDTELDDVLSQYGNVLNLCAAHLCRALAVQASRWFAYWSGDEKIDRSKCADNFLKMAKTFEDLAERVSSGDADIGIFRAEAYDPTSADDVNVYGILQG